MAKQKINGIGQPCLVYDDVNEVKTELQQIADEMGLPIEDERVLHQWSSKGDRRWTIQVGNELLAPLYKLYPTKIPLIPSRY